LQGVRHLGPPLWIAEEEIEDRQRDGDLQEGDDGFLQEGEGVGAVTKENQALYSSPIKERKRKGNAEAQRTQRPGKGKINGFFLSASLCVLCASAVKSNVCFITIGHSSFKPL